MAGALEDLRRDAPAMLMTGSINSAGIAGATETPFDTAEEAFAAAIEAHASGRFELVRVWVQGADMVDFAQIEEVHRYWKSRPE